MRKSRKNALLLGLSAAMLLGWGSAVPAFAAEETDAATASNAAEASDRAEESVSAGDVVVTASGYAEDARYAPASVTVITKEELSKKGYTDLRQVLDDVEGVDVRGANTRDGTLISIRGMEPQYTLILVDGIPQNGTMAGESNGPMGPEGHGFQMFNFLPAPSAIERIEVVRGPMSTLYGSDAMGGVINIITTKVPKEAGGNLTIDRTFETDEGRADTQRYSFLYGGPVTRDKVGLSIRGSWITCGNSTLANGSTVRGANVTPPGLKNYTIGAKTVWTPTKTSTYTFDIENARMDRTMAVGEDGATDTANTGLRYDRQRYSFSAENILKAGTWTNTLSYNDTSLHGYSGFGRMSSEPRHNKILVFDSKYVTDAIDKHTVVIGGRWWREMLRGGGEDPTARTGVPRMTADSTALFVEDTWEMSPKYTLTYGARYEMPDNYENHLTPRAYLVYKADDRWTVKGGVSTGFRAPTLGESVNGIAAFSGGRMGGTATYGNPNLKPETSKSGEIGIYYNAPNGFDAHLTFFHTKYDNKIDTMQINSAGDSMYFNTGEGKVWGLEFGTKIPLVRKLDLKLNYTLTNTESTSGDFKGAALTSTPHDSINAKLDWNPTPDTNIWFGMEYRAGTPRVPLSALTNLAAGRNMLANPAVKAYLAAGDYDPYAIFDLGISHKITKDLTVNFSIENLFDKDFTKTKTVNGYEVPRYYSNILGGRATTGTYLAGRSFWLGLSYNF